jgi:hypothetical protein
LCPRTVSDAFVASTYAYILVAVHAQALDLVHDSGVIVAFLSARLGDLATHVLEKVLRKTLLFRHVNLRVSKKASKRCDVM